MASIRRLHPGVYIDETLAAMDMTAKEFAARTGISERTLSSIINGKGDITFDVAYKLSLYFDSSINYWVNLQTQYDVYLREKAKEQELQKEWDLIKSIKKYLIEKNYVLDTDSKEDIIYKARRLVGVTSLVLLNKKDAFVCLKEQHLKIENNCFFQNFWIALALNEARKQNNVPFNKQLLLSSIKEIRSLTVQEPTVFCPRLERIFNDCGISFVLLPYLPKSNIYGATKWFSKDNVMLAVSNRGGQADLFWFTLFHEISHVLMEHRRETLINMKDCEDQDADQMAADMLIPKKEWDCFVATKQYTKDTIAAFAEKISINPTIVLARLHKEKEVPYSMFNKEFNLKYHF